MTRVRLARMATALTLAACSPDHSLESLDSTRAQTAVVGPFHYRYMRPAEGPTHAWVEHDGALYLDGPKVSIIDLTRASSHSPLEHAQRDIPAPPEPNTLFSWSPDGRTLVAFGRGLWFWTEARQQWQRRTPGSRITSVRWNNSSTLVAVGVASGDVEVWGSIGVHAQTIYPAEGGAAPVLIGWRGDQILYVDASRAVRVRGTSNGAKRAVWEVRFDPSHADWSADGTRLAVAVGGEIHVLDADDGHVHTLLRSDDRSLSSPRFTLDGSHLVAIGTRNHVWVGATNGTTLRRICTDEGLPESIDSLMPSHDGTTVIVAGDRSIRRCDLNGGPPTTLTQQPPQTRLRSLRVTGSEDGRSIAIAPLGVWARSTGAVELSSIPETLGEFRGSGRWYIARDQGSRSQGSTLLAYSIGSHSIVASAVSEVDVTGDGALLITKHPYTDGLADLLVYDPSGRPVSRLDAVRTYYLTQAGQGIFALRDEGAAGHRWYAWDASSRAFRLAPDAEQCADRRVVIRISPTNDIAYLDAPNLQSCLRDTNTWARLSADLGAKDVHPTFSWQGTLLTALYQNTVMSVGGPSFTRIEHRRPAAAPRPRTFEHADDDPDRIVSIEAAGTTILATRPQHRVTVWANRALDPSVEISRCDHAALSSDGALLRCDRDGESAFLDTTSGAPRFTIRPAITFAGSSDGPLADSMTGPTNSPTNSPTAGTTTGKSPSAYWITTTQGADLRSSTDGALIASLDGVQPRPRSHRVSTSTASPQDWWIGADDQSWVMYPAGEYRSLAKVARLDDQSRPSTPTALPQAGIIAVDELGLLRLVRISDGAELTLAMSDSDATLTLRPDGTFAGDLSLLSNISVRTSTGEQVTARDLHRGARDVASMIGDFMAGR